MTRNHARISHNTQGTQRRLRRPRFMAPSDTPSRRALDRVELPPGTHR